MALLRSSFIKLVSGSRWHCDDWPAWHVRELQTAAFPPGSLHFNTPLI